MNSSQEGTNGMLVGHICEKFWKSPGHRGLNILFEEEANLAETAQLICDAIGSTHKIGAEYYPEGIWNDLCGIPFYIIYSGKQPVAEVGQMTTRLYNIVALDNQVQIELIRNYLTKQGE
jgi:hypothetical protein